MILSELPFHLKSDLSQPECIPQIAITNFKLNTNYWQMMCSNCTFVILEKRL
uniref:Uncharacterized protein n=1 Tax=Anguilla anguilla TaxID=7936 RepID=A0A0E9X194_ANGAN